MSTVSIVAILLILLVLLFLSAFFSGAETAYSTVNFSKIESDFKKGNTSAKLIKKHYKSFGLTLATILISNNIVNIGASSLTTYFISQLMGNSPLVTIISIFIVTPLIVVFGEIIPKLLAKKYAYGYLKKIAWIMEILNKLFLPFTFFLSRLTLQSKITNSENDLKNLIQLAKNEGVLDRHEAKLAEQALDIDGRLVKQAMIRKEKIVSIDVEATVAAAKKVFISSGHSRLLVKEKGRYIGVLLLKDIINHKNHTLIKKLIKPIIGISQSRQLSKALEKMRLNRVHIALVVQKSNSRSVVGIITIEDIVEELVGEIYDEHDPKKQITEIAHYKYVADGSTKMDEIEKVLKFKFEFSEDLTLKQWIQSRITRKIKKNLRYEYKDSINFKIIRNKNKQETLIEIVKKN